MTTEAIIHARLRTPPFLWQNTRLPRLATALQQCSKTTLALSKRGSLTLPPALRRKMGLDKMRNPLLLVEERDGGLFLQPAVAMAVRDLPKEQLQAWIARDEADLKAFKEAKQGKKR
jgi:bifunctional DNA-binding transcriptional regulator/antitoxin component of YhaV-PrlF toxin-antitoxin module